MRVLIFSPVPTHPAIAGNRARILTLAVSLIALAVNPVRIGTGLNIKTMECLALGVPLVVTESGSRGLENLRGRAFLAVTDGDGAAMAAGVIRVLCDQGLRVNLVREALAAARAWNSAHLANLADALLSPVPPTIQPG